MTTTKGLDEVPGPTGPEAFRDFMADPLNRQVDYWKKYGDVFAVPFPTGPTVFLCDPDLVQQLVTSHLDHGSMNRRTEPAQGLGITLMHGDEWRRTRLIMQPMFSRPSLRTLAPMMVEAIDDRIAQLDARAGTGEVVELSEVLGGITIRVLFHSMFSDEFSDEEIDYAVERLNVISAYKGELMMQEWAPPGSATQWDVPGKQAVAELDELLYRAIRRRRADNRGQDLLGRLLAATDENGVGLTDEEVRNELTVLFFGGYETTQWAMVWTLALLALNPSTLAQAAAEVEALGESDLDADALPRLEYVKACIEEGLRHQAALLLPRQLESDDEFGGYAIPAGTLVAGSTVVVHRRADLWPDPDAFRPERFLSMDAGTRHKYQMLSFGGGPRVCLGINLSFFEAQFTLARLLRRFTYQLAPGWELRAKHQYSIVTEGGLPVLLERRDT